MVFVKYTENTIMKRLTNEGILMRVEGRKGIIKITVDRNGIVGHLLQHLKCFTTLFKGLVDRCSMRFNTRQGHMDEIRNWKKISGVKKD